MGKAWSKPSARVVMPYVKRRKFSFHLHKPETKKSMAVGGPPIWSLHWDGRCHLVHDISCMTECWTKANKTQPIAVVIGKASSVSIHDGTAAIFP